MPQLLHTCSPILVSVRAVFYVQGVQKKKKKQRSSKTLASLDSLAAELSNIPAAAAGSSKGSSSSIAEQQQALLLRGKGTKSSIKRSKARVAVGVVESSRLQKVLQHPAYKTDPIQVGGWVSGSSCVLWQDQTMHCVV